MVYAPSLLNHVTIRTVVPTSTWLSIVNSSTFFFIFGSPIPAPNPISRTASDAVDYPSRIASDISGIPGPSSFSSKDILSASNSATTVPLQA